MISALRSLLERRAQPLPDHIRRPVLGLTTVGLIAAVLWAWRTADFAVSDLRWGPVIALALIAAPASLVLKAAEFIVAARIAGQSPTRRTAAETATAFAEDLRDDGLDVLLVIDSITRFAMAHREIGLAAGELPAARGYPPSTMSALPQLLERAGTSDRGTITAIYTVLVDGDDMNDPVADAVRGILDGHIVLSRQLANSGHFPAIDVLQSVSRLAATVHNDHQQTVSRRLRELMAEYSNARDLLEVGAYVPGASKSLDDAVEHMPDINRFLMQGHSDQTSPDHTWRMLEQAIGMPRAEAREPSAPASPRERAAA